MHICIYVHLNILYVHIRIYIYVYTLIYVHIYVYIHIIHARHILSIIVNVQAYMFMYVPAELL